MNSKYYSREFREFREPGFWHSSMRFLRGFVVSANLRCTCWPFCKENIQSPQIDLRKSPQNIHNNCAENQSPTRGNVKHPQQLRKTSAIARQLRKHPQQLRKTSTTIAENIHNKVPAREIPLPGQANIPKTKKNTTLGVQGCEVSGCGVWNNYHFQPPPILKHHIPELPHTHIIIMIIIIIIMITIRIIIMIDVYIYINIYIYIYLYILYIHIICNTSLSSLPSARKWKMSSAAETRVRAMMSILLLYLCSFLFCLSAYHICYMCLAYFASGRWCRSFRCLCSCLFLSVCLSYMLYVSCLFCIRAMMSILSLSL